MGKSFKAGVNVHALVEGTSVEILDALRAHDELTTAFTGYVDPPAGGDGEALRDHLIAHLADADRETCMPLEHAAQRIVTLSQKRGPEALAQVVDQQLPDELRDEYDRQPDEMCRAAWLYMAAPDVFEDAESFLHATHHRNGGKLFEAFEINLSGAPVFEWNDETSARLEQAFTAALALKSNCTVTHLDYRPGNDEPPGHMLIVRHAGPLSSVVDHRDDGRRKPMYYRPPSEATLLFFPTTGTVELCAESPSVRQQLARSFAETAVDQDLSNKPLTIKHYDMSRFFTSLSLPHEEVDGFDIERIAVVEADARPNRLRRKYSARVPIEDDIEEAARADLGPRNIFTRAALISRVVIAVKYRAPGDKEPKTLNLTLSDPNRCNLLSNRDEAQRALGYSLLEKWRILKPLRSLSAAEQRNLLPLLLMLHDLSDDQVSGAFLKRRGIDAEFLVESGFLERRSRDTSLLIDEADGGPGESEVGSSFKPGVVTIKAPADGKPVEVPVDDVARYAVRRQWLEETLIGAGAMVEFGG